MENEFKIEMNQFLPLREVVFRAIREAILKGELKAGERLMEIQLAEKLGVSRTPIREALRKLELEGLVVSIPRKGAMVAQMSAAEFEDMLVVRKSLEKLAASLACQRMTEEEMQDLERFANEMEDAMKRKNVIEIATADENFHECIYKSSKNPKLISILNSLREQFYRYRVEYLKIEENYQQLIKEHREMICGMLNQDEDYVVLIVDQHLSNQQTAVLQMIHKSEA